MIQEAYHSETVHAASNTPATHNIVSIKNGKGYKLHEVLTKTGKVSKRTRKNLKPAEIRHIMNGQFLPGLWHGCKKAGRGTASRGSVSRKKSRSHSRR